MERLSYSAEEEPKFELEDLGVDRIDEMIALEEVSMQTETTFPFTKDELNELFENGYLAYGYKDGSVGLIAKVGFTKMPDGKVELDVCVHPNTQGKGVGKKIIEESINKLFAEDNNLDIFLKVHPKNPALRLYEKLGFKAQKESDGNYKVENTNHGPRISMDYVKQKK